jgi:hypothetical protein
MNRFFLAGLIVLSGCNQTLKEPSESSVSATSVSDASESQQRPIKYCEFSLGEAIPAGKSLVSKEVIPTEGDDRIVYTYKACDGSEQIKVELAENVIDLIEISSRGSCIDSLACVGDTYNEVLDKNPTSRLFLSRVEGATFSLLIGNNLTARFDTNGIPELCYDAPTIPTVCEKTIHESKLIALLMHRSMR